MPNDQGKTRDEKKPKNAAVKRWSVDEVESLVYIVDHDWCWQFPGWIWVAAKLGTGRSAKSCRTRWMRWLEKQWKIHNQNKKDKDA